MATTTDTTSIIDHDHGPFAAPEGELKALQRITDALDQRKSAPPKLKMADGEEVDLPPTLLRILRLVSATLAADRAVVLESMGKHLTPHEAAALLRLPITHLVTLLDDGTLPFTQDGDFRRLALDDVLAYRGIQEARSQEALAEMTRMGQEWGLNDIDYSTIKVRRLTERDGNT